MSLPKVDGNVVKALGPNPAGSFIKRRKKIYVVRWAHQKRPLKNTIVNKFYQICFSPERQGFHKQSRLDEKETRGYAGMDSNNSNNSFKSFVHFLEMGYLK